MTLFYFYLRILVYLQINKVLLNKGKLKLLNENFSLIGEVVKCKKYISYTEV